MPRRAMPLHSSCYRVGTGKRSPSASAAAMTGCRQAQQHRELSSPLGGLEVKKMEGTEATEFGAKVREAILEDGRLRSAILDLVCSCPNVVTQV